MNKLYGISTLLILIAFTGCDQLQSGQASAKLTQDQAEDRLSGLVEEIRLTQNAVSRRAKLELGEASALPPLPNLAEKYPLVVEANSADAVAVEIFVSTEKSGTGRDGWMREAAEAFNSSDSRTPSGKSAQVEIRRIPSGVGFQFISAGEHTPDAFSPSNHLWIRMVEARGVAVSPVLEETVRNVPGIVMRNNTANEIIERHQELTLEHVVNDVLQGKFAMGYTNPTASSTGLNFLISTLFSFAGGDHDAMLSDDVTSAFEQFQRGVPFVAMTTLQMRESVQRGGALDAFVMEHQTFVATKPDMTSDYEFFPFGIPHSNPLYALGTPTAEERGVLESFGQYLQSDEWTSKGREYGFGGLQDYLGAYELPDGDVLIQAQRIWKEKKDAGRPVIGVFLCDVSGSMAGTRLNSLKRGLLASTDLISEENHIGLVTFSDDVNIDLVPNQFNLLQKAAFHAGVEDLIARGNTAMYDGIAASLSLLLEARRNVEDAKLVLIVLSDGATNTGLGFDELADVVSGLKIPIYTVGYEADLEELGLVSSAVEAATWDAKQGDVGHILGSLFNAQL